MAIDLDGIVEKHISEFNDRRLEKIQNLRVRTLLRKKNPYLFIARNTVTADDLARLLVTATLSSSEETQFGQTLENIAIDVCSEAFDGYKSAATGIDLEFNRYNRRYIVAIKSGPAWGNADQIAKLRANFKTAITVIRQNDRMAVVEAVNGCCYGRTNRDYGDYQKVCGAAFWELISGQANLFEELISPLAKIAANGFHSDVELATDQVADQLKADWLGPDGRIDWARIVQHNAT